MENIKNTIWKRGCLVLAICALSCLMGCASTEQQASLSEEQPELGQDTHEKPTNDIPDPSEQATATPPAFSFIDANGKTLKDRIQTPQGYERVDDGEGSLASFLQNYPMKEDGSPVLLYDGREKGNQNAHVAVFQLPLEQEDLQQCADSVMRVYGEYYYGKSEYDKIQFPLGGGFSAEFDKWRNGYGIGIKDDTLYWTTNPENDESYESFQKFMRMVFAYSGTLNMEDSATEIPLSEISVGDIFIKGGSPGHVVMVVDLCQNADGNKAFLLAQGYMPAQEFHVLKNPLHEEDPWYYVDEVSYPLRTPEYVFEEGSLMRLPLANP